MANRARAICLGIGLMLAACPPCLASAGDEDVLAGYQRFYRGDKEGAARDFERMAAASPGRFPVRFGLLQILMDRADSNHSLEGEFERQMDAFIADAEGEARA